MIYNLASDQRRSGRGTVEARKRRRWQPTPLALEDRRLLSTIVVNNPTDTPKTGQIDLRQAIAQANTNGGNETITFDKSVFGTPQTITLTGGQLELSTANETVTITGPAGGVTVSGGGNSRVFQVDANVTASISGLTITGGTVGQNYGGGLFNHGTTSLTNCTVSGNSAGFSGGGGVATGSYSNQGGTTTLLNCTVSGNSGGGLFTFFGTTTATNTIIAGNDFDLSGSLAAASTNNLIGGDPLLAPLGKYGGTSETMALLPGSAAIGAGTSTGAPTTDQRGLPREGAVDIGAFQSSGFTIAVTSGSGQSASGAFAAPLVATVTAKNSIEPVAGGLVTFTAPASGASASIAGSPAVISADGQVSVAAASNFIGGSYTVAATAAGIEGAATFSLTNYAVVRIAVTPGNPSLAVGVAAPFTATGTFTDGSIQNITDGVAWASATPSVAAISGTGVASALAVGTSKITASLPGVTSPVDTLKVIAPSFVVNTTGDAFGFYSGTTSLREAIASANVVPGQTITFDKNVFKTPQTIKLTGGQLELSNTTGTETIIGPKAGVTVSAGGLSRVFEVDAKVTASISGMTITGGNAGYGAGGGLYNNGTTTLANCTITDNSAGGGLDNKGTTTLANCTITDNSAGGGLYNSGTATLTNCTVSGNSAEFGGGVTNSGTATLTNCTVSDNTAAIGAGGVNSFLGTTTLTNCRVSGNTAQSEFGGAMIINYGTTTLTNCIISDNSAPGTGSSTGGGGVWIGGTSFGGTTAVLTNCTVSGNTAANVGGGLYIGGGFFSGATATLINCTVSGNTAGSNGGGLFNGGGTAKLTNCTVSGNTAVSGGGIFNYGTLNVASCTIMKNLATSQGGGISTTGGTATITGSLINKNQVNSSAMAMGGGIYSANTLLSLTGCTVNGNQANGPSAMGGGISAYSSVLSLTGTTVDANQANGATAYGGGIYAHYSAVTAQNCTVVGNQANGTAIGQGGGIYGNSSAFSLVATKVSGNTATTGDNNYYSG